MPLDETISHGQAGHITDHQTIHATVNDLATTYVSVVKPEAHGNSVATALAALTDGDVLLFSAGTAYTLAAATLTVGATLLWEPGSTLTQTGTLTVNAPGGVVRLVNPRIVHDAAMANGQRAVDVTAAVSFEVEGGVGTSLRSAFRTIDVPKIRIRNFDATCDTDPAKTAAVMHLRQATTYCEVTGCRVIMPNTSATVTNSHSGIAVEGSINVDIDRNTIENGYTAIVVRESSAVATDYSQNVKVTRNVCKSQKVASGPSQGIYIQRVLGLSVTDNHILETDHQGIAIAYATTEDYVVSRNVLDTADTDATYAIIVSEAKRGVISDNVVTGQWQFGIQASDGEDALTVDNEINNSARASSRGVVYTNQTRGRIAGNHGATAALGVYLTGTTTGVEAGPDLILAATRFDDISSGVNRTTRYVTYANGAPPVTPTTTGFWRVGDRCYNRATPTQQLNISHWKVSAISSGVPTWHAFGSGWGTTAARPTLTVNDRNYTYLDTDLARVVVWSGSAWI